MVSWNFFNQYFIVCCMYSETGLHFTWLGYKCQYINGLKRTVHKSILPRVCRQGYKIATLRKNWWDWIGRMYSSLQYPEFTSEHIFYIIVFPWKFRYYITSCWDYHIFLLLVCFCLVFLLCIDSPVAKLEERLFYTGKYEEGFWDVLESSISLP